MPNGTFFIVPSSKWHWDDVNEAGSPVMTSLWEDQSRKPPWQSTWIKWSEPLMVAKCPHHRHPAPQLNCSCGIYAYPDLLDILHLVPSVDQSRYAVGLVKGYGGRHRDGEIALHDALARFAEVEVVGLAEHGSAWREGLVDKIANKIGVPVLPVNQLLEMASRGTVIPKRQAQRPDVRYLGDLAIGAQGSVLESALVVDRHGRFFVRNDREVLPADDRGHQGHLLVVRKGERDFAIRSRLGPGKQLSLPFDGEHDLASGNQRLAGRVESWWAGSMPIPMTVAARSREFLPECLEVGERLEVNPQGVWMTFFRNGEVWLPSVILAGRASNYPMRSWIKRLTQREFGLEITSDRSTDWLIVHDNKKAISPGHVECRISHLVVNGRELPSAAIPEEWFKNAGQITFPAPEQMAL
jgi:hypothetical protein